MSGLINKAKEMLHSDKKDNEATNNPQSSNAGPHKSNAMNAADPRIDSDRDNIHSGHTGTTGVGHGTQHTGTHTGTHTGASTGIGGTHTGTTGAGYGNDPRSTNAGPHSSNALNSADPRVDSDRDGSRNLGAASHTGTTGAGYGSTHTGTTGIGSTGVGSTGAGYGSSHTGTSGIGSTGAGYGNDPRSTNAGPHSSNVLNSADPRVDSDRDGSRNMGAAGHNSSTTGAGYGSTHTGTSGIGSTGVGHNTHNTHGTSGVGHNSGYSATPGSGDANKTAGPHNSDMLNKLDPRVDSDMDGSKTYGGNKTHQ